MMTFSDGFSVFVRAEDSHLPFNATVCEVAFQTYLSSEDERPVLDDEPDTSLDEAAEDERDYVRRRLRDELGREPSEEELDEWLRRHTEGY